MGMTGRAAAETREARAAPIIAVRRLGKS